MTAHDTACEPFRVYVDFDDVLCETARALARSLLGFNGTVVEYEDIMEFDLHKSFHLDDAEYMAFMEAAHTHDSLLAMPETPGACAALAAWKRDGIEPYVVTGRPVASADASRAWLDAHGLRDIPVLHVDKYNRTLGSPRPDIRLYRFDQLPEFRFGIAIDDAPPALRLLERSRLCPVLVYDRPWNRRYAPLGEPPPVRARNWTEVDAVVRRLANQPLKTSFGFP